MSRKENIAFIIEKAAQMDDTQLAALLAGARAIRANGSDAEIIEAMNSVLAEAGRETYDSTKTLEELLTEKERRAAV